jgi:hypothetical protein
VYNLSLTVSNTKKSTGVRSGDHNSHSTESPLQNILLEKVRFKKRMNNIAKCAATPSCTIMQVFMKLHETAGQVPQALAVFASRAQQL